MAVGQSFQDFREIGERLDVIELGRGQYGGHGGPARGSAVRPGKQMVLAAKRDGPDGTFHGVVVEFDAAAIKEATKGVPTGQCISDRIANTPPTRDAME